MFMYIFFHPGSFQFCLLGVRTVRRIVRSTNRSMAMAGSSNQSVRSVSANEASTRHRDRLPCVDTSCLRHGGGDGLGAAAASGMSTCCEQWVSVGSNPRGLDGWMKQPMRLLFVSCVSGLSSAFVNQTNEQTKPKASAGCSLER
jgi:hypothetical protein